MRRLVLLSAMIALFATGQTVRSNTKTAPTVPLKLNLSSPAGVEPQVAKPDFTAEFTIPAHQRLAAESQANLQAKVAVASQTLSRAGLKPTFATDYLQASAITGTPWQILAAIHKVETGQSGSTAIGSGAGAVGPMQFLPSTFAAYAIDGNGDHVARVTDVSDAIATAGRLLARGGADRGNYTKAIFNYNHSSAYVNRVLTIAHTLGL